MQHIYSVSRNLSTAFFTNEIKRHALFRTKCSRLSHWRHLYTRWRSSHYCQAICTHRPGVWLIFSFVAAAYKVGYVAVRSHFVKRICTRSKWKWGTKHKATKLAFSTPSVFLYFIEFYFSRLYTSSIGWHVRKHKIIDNGPCQWDLNIASVRICRKFRSSDRTFWNPAVDKIVMVCEFHAFGLSSGNAPAR